MGGFLLAEVEAALTLSVLEPNSPAPSRAAGSLMEANAGKALLCDHTAFANWSSGAQIPTEGKGR